MPVQSRKTFGSPSTYSFHGSNSSNSRDSGAGGRTYHMPNYATSYANEKSNLITIHLEEHKGSKRGYIIFTLLVLLIGIPIIHYSLRGRPFVKYDLTNLGASHPTPMEPFKHEDEAPQTSPHSNESSGEETTENGEAAGGERLDVYWEAPIPAERCSAYGMREYHARLKTIPFFLNGLDACQNTPIEIHGQSFASPDRCERQWRFGRVTGYWKVRNQLDCSPQWGRFEEKESAALSEPSFPS